MRAVVGIRLIGVVTLGILPFMPTFPLAATVYFLRMILQRASIPLRQSYTMAVVAPEERSSAAGMSNLPSQVSAAASPLVAGYLFETVSLELPFEIGTVLQFCNAALFFTLFRNIHPPEEISPLPSSARRRPQGTPLPAPFSLPTAGLRVRRAPGLRRGQESEQEVPIPAANDGQEGQGEPRA